jgi:putative peptide zinc metalloprotease protein
LQTSREAPPPVSAKHLALISSTLSLDRLPDDAARRIAPEFVEEHHPAGAVVMLEGHPGDRFAIIASGRAELSILDPRKSSVVVATLNPGECFGESALLEPGGLRKATVTAVTSLHLLTLNGARFRDLLESFAAVRSLFEQQAERFEATNFIKACTPFSALSPTAIRSLSDRIERLGAERGAVIVEQGSTGGSCYLVKSGSVEVVFRPDTTGTERKLATLGAGALFGEASLLLDEPRNATVRCLEPSQFLAIHRGDLLAALGTDPNSAARMFELLQVRGRPRQAAGIEVHPRELPGGDRIYVLKNPAKGTYFRLAERGWYLWQQLDGHNGMRELVTAYFIRFKAFEPAAVAHMIGGLMAAGFLEGASLDPAALRSLMPLTRRERILLGLRQAIDWRYTLRDVDPFFKRVYQLGIRRVFSKPVLVLSSVISAAGLAAFFFETSRARMAIAADPRHKWLLIPAVLACLVLHEAAHGFTTTHCGRKVNGVGIGWYWYGPIAFIDTSDIWLGTRQQRIAVSIAGPAINLILGGAAALLAMAVKGQAALALLWQFAWISYLLVLANLNPLWELDGYYVLIDWLDRPNFRKKAMEWLARELPSAITNREILREHRVEIAYGLITALYVVAYIVVLALSFRQLAQVWMGRWIGPGTIALIVYSLVALTSVALIARIIGNLRHRQ